MTEDKGKKVKNGWVDVEFLKDFGSYIKGDTKKYHSSTIGKLEKSKVVKITKEYTTYQPAKEEK